MIVVCLVTYNQEPFLAQAIESVLMQQCDEPIRVYVGDDASTDGTSAIGKRYAAEDDRVVYIRREQNMGLVGNTLDLYRRALSDQCDYIAMLDGDDYWTDNYKLQLQTDYMRTHPEVGWVHTAAYDDIDGQLMETDTELKPTGDLSNRYGLYGALHTNSTVVFRADLLRSCDPDELEALHLSVLDYPLYGIFSQYTRFGYIPTYTAAWRSHVSISQPDTWHRFIAYKKDRIRLWKWLDQRYSHRFRYSNIGAIKWFSGQLFAFFVKKCKKICIYRKKVVPL
jgi:glycosyltransferase involved in cell wall biosynthesis